MEKNLNIPFINIRSEADFTEVERAMSPVSAEPITHQPWLDDPELTRAQFIIAHNGEALFLKFIVNETHLIADEVYNGRIHHDSCVEFFIAFDEDGYYNLEFNCLGFSKIAFGVDRRHRKTMPLNINKKIAFSSVINNSSSLIPEGRFNWQILLVIPREVFAMHRISSFKDLKARGNFYKCGDKLPAPHFLSWKMIHTTEPDFHQTRSFGLLEFMNGAESSLRENSE